MRYFLFLFISILPINLCAREVKVYAPLIKTRVFTTDDQTYDEVLQQIKRDRSTFKLEQVSLDSIRAYFLHTFEYKIFPYWVGTPWDYNGYTNRPGKDKLIACGYFVSTPLKHIGFNWNRFKLAQMYSKDIVETICSDLVVYDEVDSMISKLEKRDDHLYIVGLDNHVGILLKSRGKIWFVHSNYIQSEGPVKEMAKFSEVLSYSSHYWLGTFSTDENMQKWLDGTEFPTE